MNFKIILLTSKNIKGLGINLTKCIQNPYFENDKVDTKIKQDVNSREINNVHGLEDEIFTKMSILPNLIINSTKYQSRSQQAFYTETDKLIINLNINAKNLE